MRPDSFHKPEGPRLPLGLKVIYTAFVCVLVPYYWRTYGPLNFLWVCDVALLVTLVAIWKESPYLASMQAVGIVLPQLFWCGDFLLHLVSGYEGLRISAYMFDSEKPLLVRSLSLFHGWLPLLLLWLVWRLGYDRRAWKPQIPLVWALLLASYFFTPPPPPPPGDPHTAVNVNWVFGLGNERVQTWMHPLAYLAVTMAFYPLCIYLPTHFALASLIPSPSRGEGGRLKAEG